MHRVMQILGEQEGRPFSCFYMSTLGNKLQPKYVTIPATNTQPLQRFQPINEKNMVELAKM